MRKLMVALGALGLAFGVSAVSVDPSTGSIGVTTAEAQAKKKAAPKKKVVKKAAPKKKVAKYTRRCKAGQRWNASASATAGACEKVAKVKKAKKVAKKPAKKAPVKKAPAKKKA